MLAGTGEPGGKRRLPRAEINVTSLVDVAFTLLVIFIITAPIMQGGIEVELPRAEAAPITSTQAVVVTVDRNGQIYLGDLAVSVEEFKTIFPEYVQSRGLTEAHLKGDHEVAYGQVVLVLDLLKQLDVTEVGMIVDPEPRR